MDPASIAFAELAEAYRREGRFDEAIETCRSGLERHPSYASARVTLGRALLGAGRLDEAEQEIERAWQAAPHNLAAARLRSEILFLRGDPSQFVSETEADTAPAPGAVRALESFLRAIQTTRPGASRIP